MSEMRYSLKEPNGSLMPETGTKNFRAHGASCLNRFTSAVEVANLAVYLCGEGASGTTGAAMKVDGGVVNQIM